jgi:fucose permease
MSLMFPTIMAIGGGSVMPPLQARIMDMDAFNLGFMTLSSTRASFVLPLICFVVIAIFGFRTSNVHGHKYWRAFGTIDGRCGEPASSLRSSQ